MVAEAPVISYDTETTGLDKNAVVCGYVVAAGTTSTYVPVRHASGNVENGPEYEAALAKAFKARRGRTIGHHLAFDLKMSNRHGVALNRDLEDTMINEGLIDDNAGAFSLAACSDRRPHITAKKGQPLYEHLAEKFGGPATRDQMKNFWKLDGADPMGVDYAKGDGITTLELAADQAVKILEDDLGRVHKLECSLIPYLSDMYQKGLLVDRVAGASARQRVVDALREAEKQFPSGFNPRSAMQVKKIFDAAGVTDYDTTDKGAPSFREKWLKRQPLGKGILTLRQFAKLDSSFITPLLELADENNRLHPTLNQSKGDEYGAIGGRLSCSDPNLQAFPKRNKEIGMIVRKIIIPDEGYQMGEADFKQQEPRLFGHYSKDENLCRGYAEGLNLHAMVSKILNLDYDTAKRLGMGMLTGLGIPGLAGHMECTEAQARDYHGQFMGAFPRIKEFQDQAKSVAFHRGFVKTILGRRARFPNIRYAYRGTSRIIQGSGADHMKMALVRACQFAEAEGKIDILLSIHDSTIFQFLPGAKVTELQKVLDETADLMGITVPIPTDLHIGKNWMEASYGVQ